MRSGYPSTGQANERCSESRNPVSHDSPRRTRAFAMWELSAHTATARVHAKSAPHRRRGGTKKNSRRRQLHRDRRVGRTRCVSVNGMTTPHGGKWRKDRAYFGLMPKPKHLAIHSLEYGGGASLERTLLCRVISCNREKYREYLQCRRLWRDAFRLKCPPDTAFHQCPESNALSKTGN